MRPITVLIASALAVLPVACVRDSAPAEARSPVVEKAVCVLRPTEGNQVSGTVTFTRASGGVRIVADVRGLSPGRHGFHIHQWGDIDCADGKCAGGHFNPDGVDHGAPDDAVRHVGDLGNLVADDQGVAHYDRVDSVIALSGPHGIIGRAIIVHAKGDDLKSQPTGAAGPRVAYGVIGIADPNR